MTIKEAIRDLQQNIKSCESLRMAVEALEKQIPKRVIRRNWQIAKCPCCRTELGEWLEDGYHHDYEELKVCNCGQQLDWSYPEDDENEDTVCCELCRKEKSEIEWITHHYGVCRECYETMTPEEIQDIIEIYG